MTLPLQLTPEQQAQLLAAAERFNSEMERRRTPFPSAETLSQLKAQLQEALNAQDGFADFWEKSAYQHDDSQLRLVHESTAVRNLPWQLALEGRPQVAVCKSTEVEIPSFRPTTGYPLKVLVMVAAPEGVTVLDYEKEEKELLTAFSPLMAKGLVEVHFTDDGSLENLREKLLENRYHILHYFGHGSYEEGEGYLALENLDDGSLYKAKAAEVNDVFREAYQKGHRPDLVVLSACQTAQGVEESNLGGTANILLQGGIPAMIAMSASIVDVCATQFAATFYEHLAEDFTLDYAFQKARLAVREFEISCFDLAKDSLAPGQWLIPQLLLSQEVEHLVDKRAPRTELNFKQETAYATGQQGLLQLRVRPKNYVFIGRRKERRETIQVLKEGKAVLLRGQGGMGKTALAEHLAIRMLAGNPRTKVFTHSEQQPAAQSLLDQLRDYLTKEQRKTSVVTALQEREKLTDKFLYLLEQVSIHCDPLFIFDNIESFQRYNQKKAVWVWNVEDHEDVFTLLQCLKQYSDFPIILTGRYPLAEFPDWAMCDLNAVPFGDFFKKCWQLPFCELASKLEEGAVETGLLKQGEDGSKTTFQDLAALLHKTLGGNYRALEFFDELYAQDKAGIEAHLDELSKLQDRIKDSDILQRMSQDIIFQQLLSFLNEEDKDILGLLAHFRIPVLPMAIGYQREAADRSDSLNQLSSLTLMEKQSGSDQLHRYYVTSLLKELLKKTEFPEVPFDAKQAGAYHEYIATEGLEVDLLSEYIEAFEWYYKAGNIPGVNRTGRIINRHYYDSQQFKLSLTYGLRVEKIAGEETDRQIWNIIGNTLMVFGKYDAALVYFEKLLLIQKEIGNRQGEGTTLNNISQVYQIRGDYTRALSYLESSLSITKQVGDIKGEGATLNSISQIFYAKGDYVRALKYLESSLSIQKEIGDRKGEGATLNNIGQIHQVLGDYGRALRYLESSLSIQKEIGDREGEGATLNNIGQIHQIRDDYTRALRYLESSLLIQKKIGNRKGEGVALNNISQIYDAKGDYARALSYLESSLLIQKEIGDRKGEGGTLNNLGATAYEKGDYALALRYLESSLSIQKEIGDLKGEGATLNNISQIHQVRGDYAQALRYLESSLSIRQEIGDREGEGETLNNIGRIYQVRGDYALAQSYLESSLSIQKMIGDINGMAVTLHNMGAMSFEQNHLKDAISPLFKAYQLFEQIKSPNSEGSLSYLSAIAEKIGQEEFKSIITQLQKNE